MDSLRIEVRFAHAVCLVAPGRQFGHQRRVVSPRHAVAVAEATKGRGGLAGNQAGPGGNARRARGIGPREDRALPAHHVEVRRLSLRMPGQRQAVASPLVGEYENNVRLPRLGRWHRGLLAEHVFQFRRLVETVAVDGRVVE